MSAILNNVEKRLRQNMSNTGKSMKYRPSVRSLFCACVLSHTPKALFEHFVHDYATLGTVKTINFWHNKTTIQYSNNHPILAESLNLLRAEILIIKISKDSVHGRLD
jgi:hypothetical protein